MNSKKRVVTLGYFDYCSSVELFRGAQPFENVLFFWPNSILICTQHGNSISTEFDSCILKISSFYDFTLSAFYCPREKSPYSNIG